jgi:hypothetical protein
MWSDECSAERGKGRSGEWCFRTAAEKWEPKMVSTYKKSRDISVMVWACFWFMVGKIHRSDLLLLDRDWESKKKGTLRALISRYWTSRCPSAGNQASYSCRITPLSIWPTQYAIGS